MIFGDKRINKHIYTWIGTFLFGLFGVDRFMRGQIGFGILKLIVGAGGVWIVGLGGIWMLIDWIIALTKLGKYKKDFIFVDGKWEEEGAGEKAEYGLGIEVKKIENELNKQGYTLSSPRVFARGDGEYRFMCDVYKGDEKSGEKIGSINTGTHIFHEKYITCPTHMIFLEKGPWIINSNVPSSDPPPEWLKICGQVIRLGGYTISYPEWVNEELKKCINTVFV